MMNEHTAVAAEQRIRFTAMVAAPPGASMLAEGRHRAAWLLVGTGAGLGHRTHLLFRPFLRLRVSRTSSLLSPLEADCFARFTTP